MIIAQFISAVIRPFHRILDIINISNRDAWYLKIFLLNVIIICGAICFYKLALEYCGRFEQEKKILLIDFKDLSKLNFIFWMGTITLCNMDLMLAWIYNIHLHSKLLFCEFLFVSILFLIYNYFIKKGVVK